MSSDTISETAEEGYYDPLESGVWIEPGVHHTLALVADDVVCSLRRLSREIGAALPKIHEATSEIDRLLFEGLSSRSEGIAYRRFDLYKLMVAICCEEFLNRFAYFELPTGTREIVEKLQPTEKLLMIAAFGRDSGIKSSHVYEGLKHMIDWRNRFAHGHNTFRPARTLHSNHVAPLTSRESLTLRDELQLIQKTSAAYENLMSWLLKAGTHAMMRCDSYYLEACRMTQMFSCFTSTEHCFPPDDEGERYKFFSLDVDEASLAELCKASVWLD